jgi:LuxR family maltose regulon positive regulatory protein
MRATLAVMQHDVETIIAQSRRALEHLHPDNLTVRTAATWTLGYASQLQGDRAAASQAYAEVISTGEASGGSIYTIAATINLGQVQEAENQLHLARRTYGRVLQLAGDPPRPIACEAYLGLARILYQWNDLEAAEQHGQRCAELTQQMQSVDTSASYEVFLARLRLARGDVAGAAAVLDEAEEFVRRHNFVFRAPDVAAAQVLVSLRQGNLAAAAHLAQRHRLPISQAQVHLARGDPPSALAVLEPLRRQADAKGWADERLELMVLQALAHHAQGDMDEAVQLLGEALALAKPGGFIRIFVDEGVPMARLLYDALDLDVERNYVRRLLAAYPVAEPEPVESSRPGGPDSEMVEPLSEREIEVLQLIAEGLTNQQVASRLYLSLHTVKVHTRNIFTKLAVKNRTQAVARGRALGILSRA